MPVNAAAADGGSAVRALEQALQYLLAGDLRQADLALLQADQLDPSLALVPDVWGLWPAPAAAPGAAVHPAERQRALELAQRFRSWRHPDLQELWQQLLPRIRADWRAALEPPAGDWLLILGRAAAGDAAERLDPPLEPELTRLVADAEIAAEPAASSRYWQRIATIRPQWDLARIRAADLSLARGDLMASARWLADAPASARRNPWFHDISARHALARDAVDTALQAWGHAIQLAEAQDDGPDLVAVFEQRRREARRGPGVLQVRSLAKRGEPDRARALLDNLLAEDPQWAPLRHLREQLATSTAPQVRPTPAPAPAAAPALPAHADAKGPAGGLDAVLHQATARLAALGVSIPAPPTTPTPDLVELASELAALEARFSDYEARFALA